MTGVQTCALPICAWDEWHALGEPELYDYGLTVEPDRQYAWCKDAATGPRWLAPA